MPGRLHRVAPCSFGLLLALWLAFPLGASAAEESAKPGTVDPNVARRWASVTEWIGFWEASETRTIQYRSSLNASLWSDSLQDAQTSSQFRLARRTGGAGTWDPAEGTLEWVGTGIERWVSLESSAESGSSAHDTQTVGSDLVRSSALTFRINLKEGLTTFGPGANERTPSGTMTGWVGSNENRRSVNLSNPLLRAVPTLYKGEKRAGWWGFSDPPGVISFNDGRTTNKQEGDGTWGYNYHGHVVLCPVYDDLECEVTIDGYAEWLPLGSIRDPQKPGNALVAHAVLKSKRGKSADIPEVDRFRIELVGTSQEPGVCLNWPLGAQDHDYDFKLADFTSGSGGADPAAAKQFLAAWGLSSMGNYDREAMPGNLPSIAFPEISADGQKGELVGPPKDKEGRPFVDLAIECFDFGAKSELRVVCVLKDGREIIGLMKTEEGAQDLVRLPQRAAADWVAAKWRVDAETGDLPAGDDNEKVDGQPMNGDGFTLYEEYRGWIVGGKHRQGDPKRKDFFVLNQRGADFRGGIALFERVSQLRVHSTLRDGQEMSDDERCMNRNHRAAPHRVEQHGVILARDQGLEGGLTVGVDEADPDRAFRPKSVKLILLEGSEAGRGTDTFSIKEGQGYNLTPRDAERAWDRGVAHEILHAVGVDHHGEKLRERVWCYFQSANFPLNTSGRHRFVANYSLSPKYYFQDGSHPLAEAWTGDSGAEIKLLWEDTRKDVFEDDLAEYERKLQFYRSNTGSEESQKYLTEVAAKLAHSGKSAEWWGRYIDELAAGADATRVIWVGARGGTDSGNDLCVMKYYFANAYRVTGKPHDYYVIRPGNVHAGRQICHSPAGTGANASDHAPQSRFGDAFAGRGDCFGQICPNDAIPPRRISGD